MQQNKKTEKIWYRDMRNNLYSSPSMMLKS